MTRKVIEKALKWPLNMPLALVAFVSFAVALTWATLVDICVYGLDAAHERLVEKRAKFEAVVGRA